MAKLVSVCLLQFLFSLKLPLTSLALLPRVKKTFRVISLHVVISAT